MNRRFEITDEEWERLAPLLPAMTAKRGGRWRDHCQVLNGILFRTRTGIPWRDLPERYGPWETSTSGSRAGRPTAPGRASRPPCARRRTLPGSWAGAVAGWAEHQAPHHLRRPWPQPGDPADARAGRRHHPAGRAGRPGAGGASRSGGRPRQRPDHLTGDKAYSSRANRVALRARHIRHTIPERDDQKAHRGRRGGRGGRPPAFDRQRHRSRNQVERLMNRRKQFRAVATRFDKLAVRYRATIAIADIFIWLLARPDQPHSHPRTRP